MAVPLSGASPETEAAEPLRWRKVRAAHNSHVQIKAASLPACTRHRTRLARFSKCLDSASVEARLHVYVFSFALPTQKPGPTGGDEGRAHCARLRLRGSGCRTRAHSHTDHACTWGILAWTFRHESAVNLAPQAGSPTAVEIR